MEILTIFRLHCFLLLAEIQIMTCEERGALTTVYGCSGSTVSLSCEGLSVLEVMRANYGRLSISTCNPDNATHWGYNCLGRRTKTLLDKRLVTNNLQ